ncbi:MAG: zinc finger domain-containing protein, partial [Clostridia bacterium]|nr:zinc finger domain-containing protein [Clostridia bacterium]
VQGELAAAFIVSQAGVSDDDGGAFRGGIEGLGIDVEHADGHKCERCWAYSETVGQNTGHPTLCARCAGIAGNT